MSATPIGRSAVFLYIESITLMLPGYLYWLILSRLVSQEVIGSFSTVVSLSAITSNIIMLGIPIGCQRFMSKSLSEEKNRELRLLIESSLVIITIAAVLWSMFMVIFNEFINDNLNLSPFLNIFLIVLTCSTAYYTLFRAFVISTLNTRVIASTTVITTVVKFSSAFVLILVGQPFLGIATGIILFPLVATLFLGVDTVRLIEGRRAKVKTELGSILQSGKLVITASMAGWIPSLITVIGTNLGIVVVNSIHGPSSAAVYFIAFAIVTAISGISSVFFSIGYPLLSAMKDGRKRSTLRMTRLCLIIIIPLTFSILFYSREVMGIFGESYVEGWIQLDILLFSVFPVTISGFMTILAYSYGKYKESLLIGIALTLPRVLLYFLLVPFYGAEGAALSYLAGSWIGLVPAFLFSRSIRLHLNWKSYLVISFSPLLISITLSALHLPVGIGILGTLLITYTSFLFLKILDRADVAQFLTILPKSLQKPKIIDFGLKLAKKINRSF